MRRTITVAVGVLLFCALIIRLQATTITVTARLAATNGDGQHDGQPWGHGGGIVGEVTLTNSTLSGNNTNLSAGGISGSGALGNTILNYNSDANITGTM